MSSQNNGGNPNGAKVISIETTPPKLDQLKEMVNNPSEIDGATIELGIPPFLLNLGLAVATDLSFLNIGLGKAVYVPRQVTDRDGGRKSQYKLCKGETTQAGVYFSESGMMLRFVTRVTGDTKNAKTGDIFMEQYRTREGRLIYEGTGVLQITDERKGIGQYELAQTNTPQYAVAAQPSVKVWIIWSAILIEVE